MLKPIKHIGSDFEVNGNGLPYGAFDSCRLFPDQIGIWCVEFLEEEN